jgi:3'(2'), 5'-bisphosphate nucleotidase
MSVYAELQQKGTAAKTLGLTHKDDGSPLTRADLAAHQIISQRLRALTPEVPVVSEEDSLSMRFRLPAGEYWLVDPLDGTKEFLAQNGEFTVNIALVRDGKAVFGAIVAPVLAQAYWGGEGLGAFREADRRTEAIRVAQPPAAGRPLRVLASKSHMNAETEAFIARLGECELLQAGSSLKFCRLAEGGAELYPRLGPTCEWDTAAAQAIVEAAGGQVTQLDGAPLHYGKPDVLNPHFVASSVPLPQLLRSR